jgi:TorA maturation chaperone TorD
MSVENAVTAEQADVEQIKEVLASRASFYRMLASLYFNTLTSEQIESLANTDLSPYAEVNEDFADGINDITRYLRKRNTGTRDELATDFTGTFVGTKAYEGKVAVPYESVFTSDEGLLYQESYHQVFHEFKREAVKRAEGVDWPDDHLSFMCEFMAILSDRIARALDEGDSETARHELEVSSDFLDKHMLSWFEDFAALADKLIETRFYRGVIKITRGFFKLDRETLDDLKAQLGA